MGGEEPFHGLLSAKRVLDVQLWKLIYDVLRFNACAGRLLLTPESSDFELSIGEYLAVNNYSESFKDNYLIVSPLGFLNVTMPYYFSR